MKFSQKLTINKLTNVKV